MKTMRSLTWTIALLLLAGCATTFRPWLLSEVHEGMDRAEVVKILGEPDSVLVKDGTEQLFYSYQEDFNPVATGSTSYENSLMGDQQRQEALRTFKEYRYVVILSEGKVLNYKQLDEP